MRSFIKEFSIYCVAERGLSNRTAKCYVYDIEKMYKFFNYKMQKKRWREVSYDDLRLFFSKEGKSLSDSSLFRTIMSIRAFFKFLRQESEIEENALLKIDAPKVWYIIPDVLTEEEVQSIINATDISNDIGLRDRAIIEIMYSSGLRVSEVSDLKIYDIYKNRVEVKIGKGGKGRQVPIGAKAIKAIDEYILIRKSQKDVNNLFVNRRGEKLTRFGIWRRIKWYAKITGIEKKITPHSFRRSFATHLYKNGVNLSIIKDLLGHESINTTDIYAKLVDDADFKKEVLDFSPIKFVTKEEIMKLI